ncbi:hypothetical protein [Lacticaseibacillus yichunensis]|uniref:Uncharacterized protein n=1 Tax=Lacticaseibacillus yichunensis TaxID=2486015 RepID=A0ABW4CPY9_9LACO|nr:hypothetical protein [Lacticaseibacillus yichunensis]
MESKEKKDARRVKETLKTLTWPKKIGYLWYSYKGWVIAVVAVLAMAISIGVSVSGRSETVLSVRLMGDEDYSEVATELKKDYEKELNLGSRQIVDVSAVNLNQYQDQDALTAQVAGNQIDLVWVLKSSESKRTKFFKNTGMTREPNIKMPGKYGKLFVAYQPAKVPHPKTLAKIK